MWLGEWNDGLWLSEELLWSEKGRIKNRTLRRSVALLGLYISIRLDWSLRRSGSHNPGVGHLYSVMSLHESYHVSLQLESVQNNQYSACGHFSEVTPSPCVMEAGSRRSLQSRVLLSVERADPSSSSPALFWTVSNAGAALSSRHLSASIAVALPTSFADLKWSGDDPHETTRLTNWACFQYSVSSLSGSSTVSCPNCRLKGCFLFLSGRFD